jgi:hypothetical protein
MTEQEWLSCTDPRPILEFLKGKASDRKLRLFAVACVRRVWAFLPPELTYEVVRLAEDFVDGKATAHDLGRFRKLARKPVLHPSNFVPLSIALLLGNDFSSQEAAGAAEAVIRFVGWECRGGRPVEYILHQEVVQAESKAQTMLLHDILGNPFHAITLDPGWQTTNVRHLAQAIYDMRDFDHLPGLADALEQSGCTSQDILDHCRGAEPHVRGCWVLDLILGKK